MRTVALGMVGGWLSGPGWPEPLARLALPGPADDGSEPETAWCTSSCAMICNVTRGDALPGGHRPLGALVFLWLR